MEEDNIADEGIEKEETKKEKPKHSPWNYESDHETLGSMVEEFGNLEDDEEWED